MCEMPQDLGSITRQYHRKPPSNHQNCLDRFTYRDVSYEFRSLFYTDHVIYGRTLEIDTCFRPTIPFPPMKALISGDTAHLLYLEL
jgi:hypothetical protein